LVLNMGRVASSWKEFKEKVAGGFDAGTAGRDSVFETPSVDFRTVGGVGDFVGRLGADLAGNFSRNFWWKNNHPLGVADSVGEKAVMVNGLPYGYQTLGGAALALGVLPVLSGNLDITNLGQGGRPQGYQALFPNPIDQTQTTNQFGELLGRYVLGRKGNILPYEKFVEERPDISPENYAAFKGSTGWMNKDFFGLQDTPAQNLVAGIVAGGLLGAYRKRGRYQDGELTPRVTKRMGTYDGKYVEMPDKLEQGTVDRLMGGAVRGGLLGGLAGAAVAPLTELGAIRSDKTVDGQDAVTLLGYQTPLTAIGLTGLAAFGLRKAVQSRLPNAEKVYEELDVLENLKNKGSYRDNGQFIYDPVVAKQRYDDAWKNQQRQPPVRK
jgi:hypothetical protein